MKSPIHDAIRSVNRETFCRRGLLALALILLAAVAGCGGDKEADVSPIQSKAMVPTGTSSVAAGDSLVPGETGMDWEEGADLPDDGNPEAAVEVGSSLVGGVRPVELPAADQTGQRVEGVSLDLDSAVPGGRYILQLGSFQNRAYAEKRSDQIRAAGFEPVIQTVDLAGVDYHRVLVRGISDRAAATAIGEELQSRLDITYLIKRGD